MRWGDERARNPGRTAAERGEQRRAVGARRRRSAAARRAGAFAAGRTYARATAASGPVRRRGSRARDRRGRRLRAGVGGATARPSGADDGRAARAATAASGSRSQRQACAGVRHASAASVVRLHSSMPSQPSAIVECRPGVRQHDPARERRVEHVAAVRERMGGETDAACRAHRGRDLARRPPGVRDLLHDAEREVMALPGAHLRPHEQEHAVVRALPTVAPCAQRVVVGEQHRLGPRVARRVEQLGHGRRSVRVRRMHVDDARDVERDRRIPHPAIFTPAAMLDGCPGASSVSSASRSRAS